jgi:ABC-2 type transport system permease protein
MSLRTRAATGWSAGAPGSAGALSLVFRRESAAAGRDPGPAFVLPATPALLMTVVFTALFDRISEAQGYGGGDYDAFLLPGVVVLVALLGAGATSASLAADLRSGYFDRLRLLPARPVVQLTGRLLFEATRLLPGTAAVLALGLLLGGRNDNGPAGVVAVVALVSLLGVAYSGVFYAVAIRTRDPQTPLQLQPLGLPLAFLSTALVPLAVMPTWAETLARYNPVTPVVDASREALVGDLWSDELLVALVVLAGANVVTQALAWRALHSHVARG